MCFILKCCFNTLRSNWHTIFGVIKILRWNILNNYQINFILFYVLDEPCWEAFKYWHNLTFLKLRWGRFNYSNSTYRHICKHGGPCFSIKNISHSLIPANTFLRFTLFFHTSKQFVFLIFFQTIFQYIVFWETYLLKYKSCAKPYRILFLYVRHLMNLHKAF